MDEVSLLVLDGRLRSIVPDGSRLKKLCVGWVSWREGRVTPTIFSAALSMHWTVLQQDTLQAPYPHSDAASQDSSVEGAHDWSQGSGSSKYRCCWAFLASVVVLLVQERSTPRNLMLFTLSTVAPLMVRGAYWVCTLLTSTHPGMLSGPGAFRVLIQLRDLLTLLKT